MKDKPKLKWDKIRSLESRSYECGYCGHLLASQHGWIGQATDGKHIAYIYVCHYCTQPTYFYIPTQKQIPGSAYGAAVEHITERSIENLYEEARRCTTANAFTAAVLCCRKLLMHIAVDKGAKPGESFKHYVDFLAGKGYIPPDGEEWVDHIRDKGNEANHEIVIMEPDDAEALITFVEMLLKFIYEYPRKIKKDPPETQS